MFENFWIFGKKLSNAVLRLFVQYFSVQNVLLKGFWEPCILPGKASSSKEMVFAFRFCF